MIVLAHRMAKIYLADMTLRGSLPPGLKLDPAAISGTPAKAGTYAFTITATNDFGNDSATYTVTIAAADPDR